MTGNFIILSNYNSKNKTISELNSQKAKEQSKSKEGKGEELLKIKARTYPKLAGTEKTEIILWIHSK